MKKAARWRWHLAGVLAVLALLPAQSWGLTIFQAHFNGSLLTAEGQAPAVAENVQFAPGRCATQGIMVTDETKLQYPALGNVSLYQGTFSVWIKPVGWRGGVPPKTRYIFNWNPVKTNKQNAIQFVQNGRQTVNVLLRGDDGSYLQPCARPSLVFSDGVWVHLAAAWSAFDRVLQLYVNGKLVEEKRRDEPLTVGQTGELFSIGGVGAYSVDGIIDEVVISDRCLTPEELMAQFRKPIAAYSD